MTDDVLSQAKAKDMRSASNPNDGEAGVSVVRKRYCQRARTLLQEQEFARALHITRNAWNTRCPHYVISTAADMDSYWPKKILIELEELSRMQPLPIPQWNKVVEAWCLWGLTTDSVCNLYFPENDFPTSRSRALTRPGIRFVCAAIAANRLYDLEEDIDQLFPESDFAPMPESMAPSHILLQAISNPSLIPHILKQYGVATPHYPDLTSSHIEEQASAIAARVNDLLHDRTQAARIDALEAEGYSRPAIATRLGYKVETLKKRRQRG